MSSSFYNKKYENEEPKRVKLSIAVPTHEFPGNDYFFKRLLDSLWNQSFQDFEVVVTDNSENNVIRDICIEYGVSHVYNPRKGMAQNTNEAIKASKGELIKILYMDDYLAHNDALQDIIDAFRGNWLITGSDNNPTPYWTDDIETGNNKLGSPSALTIRNVNPLLFDEEMTWLLDCDYYRRMYDLNGKPVILEGKHVNIGLHDDQLTHTMGQERKLQEEEYMAKKYAK